MKEPYGDRTTSPIIAFHVARSALHNHDLVTYVDALTDNAVRFTLENSIGICTVSQLAETQKFGYKKSTGCDLILLKYGWVEPPETIPEKIGPAWKAAIMQIRNPRNMLIELETNHRSFGAGSSFVWSYLDPIEITRIIENESKAHAESKWAGDSHKLLFEKDETGWRFDPNFEE